MDWTVEEQMIKFARSRKALLQLPSSTQVNGTLPNGIEINAIRVVFSKANASWSLVTREWRKKQATSEMSIHTEPDIIEKY